MVTSFNCSYRVPFPFYLCLHKRRDIDAGNLLVQIVPELNRKQNLDYGFASVRQTTESHAKPLSKESKRVLDGIENCSVTEQRLIVQE